MNRRNFIKTVGGILVPAAVQAQSYLPHRRKAFSFVGPLDGYTAPQGVWSVTERLLSSYTGALCRVRRSSDSAEVDVMPAGTGVLDTSAMLAWSGSDSVYVVTVYDQSSSARNITQATASKQPRLVNAGSVETINGLPVMNSAPVTSCTLAGSITFAGDNTTWFTVATLESSSQNYGRLISCGSAATDLLVSQCIPVLRNLSTSTFAGYCGGALPTKAAGYSTAFTATGKTTYGGGTSTASIQVDATAAVTASIGGGPRNYTHLTIFNPTGGAAEQWSGKAGTFIYYESVPSNESSIRDYLRNRYGTS